MAWAERTGRRRAAEPRHGGLRSAFYGRVPTEDYQDPVTSRARQRDQAGVVVTGPYRDGRADPGAGPVPGCVA